MSSHPKFSSFTLILAAGMTGWVSYTLLRPLDEFEPRTISRASNIVSKSPQETAEVKPELQHRFAQSEPDPAFVEPSLDLADVATRQRFYDQLLVLPIPALLAKMRLLALADETTSALLQEGFITALRASGSGSNNDLTTSFAETLSDLRVPVASRVAIAQNLALSNTLPALEALLQVAGSSNPIEPELKFGLHKAISTIGAERRENGEYPTDLSRPLELAFSRSLAQPSGADSLTAATGQAMAQIGTDSGVRALLAFVAKSQPFPTVLDHAITHIRNPDAIPALLTAVRGTPPSGTPGLPYDSGLLLSGSALVHIGGEEAVRPLLEWLLEAPPSAEPLASKWFKNTREPVSIGLVGAFLKERAFRSPEIRSALGRQLAATAPEEM